MRLDKPHFGKCRVTTGACKRYIQTSYQVRNCTREASKGGNGQQDQEYASSV
jgi:hypothetical protein